MAARIPLIALLAGLLGALVLSLAAPASAFPSSTPNAAWPTAKVDAQLKPHFRELIGLDRRHWGYERPSWSRWRNFYWRGDGYGGGGYGGSQGYCDPYDPYCQAAGYGCNPGDPYCQSQGGGYSEGYPQQGYGGCDPTSGICSQLGGEVYSGRPGWVGGDPYSLPAYGLPGGSIYDTYGGRGREHISIDCRREEPGRIQRALDEVAEGGTIHLRGRGPACSGTLQIGRPVIIQGDPPAAFPIDGDAGPAVITAPPGSPCAVIDAGPRAGVEFRDVVIESAAGGRSACLQTFSSAVALVRTAVNYSGESSALYVQGGRVVANDAEINSSGYDAAIWAEDATLGFRNVGINAASTGLDVKPGIGQTIALNHVSIVSNAGGPNGGGPMSGIIGRRGRGGDCAFVIENSYVGGFRTGLLFEAGLRVEVSRSRIDQSRMGIAIDGGTLVMRGTAIDATEYGVYAYSGRGEITGGYVTSVLREPFGADPGAVLVARDVSVYADGCGGWGRHDGWLCHGRREAPEWLARHEHGGHGHWGFDH